MGAKVDQKSINKKEVKMGRHLGIDFSSILVDLGGQVGKPNRAKREPKQDMRGQGRPSQGLDKEDQDQAKPRRRGVFQDTCRRRVDDVLEGGGVSLTLKGETLPRTLDPWFRDAS